MYNANGKLTVRRGRRRNSQTTNINLKTVLLDKAIRNTRKIHAIDQKTTHNLGVSVSPNMLIPFLSGMKLKVVCIL